MQDCPGCYDEDVGVLLPHDEANPEMLAATVDLRRDQHDVVSSRFGGCLDIRFTISGDSDEKQIDADSR